MNCEFDQSMKISNNKVSTVLFNENEQQNKQNISKIEKRMLKHNRLRSINECSNSSVPLLASSNGSVCKRPSIVHSNSLNNINKIKNNKNSCLIEDSPFYIHKIAQTDRLNEFERLYFEDPTRLLLKDNNRDWLPLFYAVFKSKLKIIEFILKYSGDDIDMINFQDLNGNTPLHIAIINGNLECCMYLLDNQADTSIKNNKFHAPIHQCILSNQPEILDKFLSHSSHPDIHLGGENGQTALHYCAYYENLECARILINHGTELCRPCNYGFFPIHVAAQRCSNKILKFLIDEATKKGCAKLNLLSFVDGDNNKPLYAAVQFGNVEAVRLCLENGASIDEISEEIERSTPVHVASSQGSLDILEIMDEIQADLFFEVLQLGDSMMMTPLHKAAMFDHIDIAKFLIKKGAYIDAVDIEKRTPMLLAATRNCVRMVCYLLSEGASLKLKDQRQRNVLHLIIEQDTYNSSDDADKVVVGQFNISSNSALEAIINELSKKPKFSDLLNEQDIEGWTAIHYACKLGYLFAIKLLIEKGADINIKNNEKQSPLHISAKFGRYNSCLELLKCGNNKTRVNEKDSYGNTPLNLASQNGHSRVVEMLLQKGARIYKSYLGNNPFHDAAYYGSVACLKKIYSIHQCVLNTVNRDGDTALHLASQHGHSNVIEFLLDSGIEFKANKNGLYFIDLAIKHKQIGVLMTIVSHNRWREALDLNSIEYKTPFIGIIQTSSEVTQAIMERCITKSHHYQQLTSEKCNLANREENNDDCIDLNLSVHYDFKYLNWSEERVDSNGKEKFYPMLPLMTMVSYGRTECLSHPLCEKLLQRKWARYGMLLYGLSTLFYMLFLISLTLIVVTHPSCIHTDLNYIANPHNYSMCQDVFKNDPTFTLFFDNNIYFVLSSICLLFSLMGLIKEGYHLIVEKCAYFRGVQSYIQIILYPITMCFVGPFLIRNLTYSYSFHSQWEFGAISIFLAWFNLLLYMQRFNIFGIYIVMFCEILTTLVRVIFIFLILLIGFALAFYILLGNDGTGANINSFISLCRTFIMMLGETDGLNSFIIPYVNGSLHFGRISLLFLIVFIFLIPILLTNLLIGLAVGDIESVQRNARLKRQAMQIDLYVELERKISRKMRKKLNEMEYTSRIDKNSNKYKIQRFIKEQTKDANQNEKNDSNQLFYIELINQKQRMNILKSTLDRQTNLIESIVRNMGIKSDFDNFEHQNDIIAQKRRQNMILNRNANSNKSCLRTMIVKQLMSNNIDEENEI